MSESETTFKEITANPAPLGLAAFGMTTILLNLHNAGFFPLSTVIVVMGVLYGGLAQVIVGIMEWKKNNTFGTVAFTSYGFFWLALVGIWYLPQIGAVEKPSSQNMACFLAVWGVFSIFLFIGTFKASRALQIVFGSVVLLFALLVVAKAYESHMAEQMAGYVGIFCGTAALYTGMAQVLNEQFGKKMLPLG